MNPVFRFAFWAAVAIVIYLTLRPIVIMVPTSDKTQHAVTFAMLMAMAALAYPRIRLDVLAAGLAMLGGAIELIQPYFERSRDVKDWIADLIGIALAWGVMWIVRRMRSARTV